MMASRIFSWDFGIGRIYGIGDTLTISKYLALVSEGDYPNTLGTDSIPVMDKVQSVSQD